MAPAPLSKSERPSKSEGSKSAPKKITVPFVREAKAKGERLVMLTAYDYPQARLADQAGVDVVLVGDSLAMVVLGHADTLSVTMDEMLHHVKAARRGCERALLVADMPYGSFHLGPESAVANALRFVKEGGASAVKIEGARVDVVRALVDAEIPVMGHVGLTPQSIHRFGGFKVQGRGADARAALLEAATALEEAGAFSLVLECIPTELAREVGERLSIPTIGIGAGPYCDGQVLVWHDLLGIEERIAPRFVRRYAELGRATRDAVAAFARDVRSGAFPSREEGFEDPLAPKLPKPETIGRLYGA
jgi:3-methyl-2-oxobutanoate hydroxymethyltransferase